MRSIWAIAVNTIKQALRMKIAVVFILLLAVLLSVMALSTTGDYTLKGRLQTFVSYGLSLTSLLLCLLTTIITVHTITSDIEHRQIYTVITKPIRRYEFLLGKLLGVMLLSASLLVLFTGLIYAIAIYTPRFTKASQAEILQAQHEFFTARKSVKPPDIDVSKEVAQVIKNLEKTADIAHIYQGMTRAEVEHQLTNLRRLAKRTADLGHEIVWEFDNVRPSDPNGWIFVKFKCQSSDPSFDVQVISYWGVGDYRPYKYGTDSEAEFYRVQRKDPVGKFREIRVKADAAADDGYLAVVFFNDPANAGSVIFPLEDGIEVLYKADSFTSNYLRGVLLILFRLVFLACLGALAATFLSFPVAILLSVVLFFIANISGFIIESFFYLADETPWFYIVTIQNLISLLPQFDKFNPSKFLVAGELISWSLVGNAAVFLVCIKSLLLLFFAIIIFTFRELARIVV